MNQHGIYDTAVEKLRLWRKVPVQMVRDLFKVEPDPWQADVLEAFASNDPDKQRIAMKANKGPGKTAVLAWIIWNFMLCYALVGEHPQGAATGISEKNLDDNLWKELAKWQGRSDLLTREFEWTKSRISHKVFFRTWFFSKRTWSKSADPQQQADTLAGIHAKFILFVIDESGGVPSSIMATAEGGLATVGTRGKIVQAGNPTHLTGPLYDACTKHRSKWHVIEITGDPDDPKRSPRIDKEWARQQIEMYGRNNPWVLVNVFGQFPPASLNALIGPDEVKAAMERVIKLEDFSWAQKRLGIDVARFGDDRTVLFPRQGLCAGDPVIMRGVRTTEIAARVMLAKRNWGQEMEFIDDTGHWGHGVLDNLYAAGHAPVPVVFHAPAIDPRYANRRAEMLLECVDWVKRGGVLPYIPELIEEMTECTYTFVKGKFLIEDKDLIKERIGRSPDLFDGLALTFAVPDSPGNPDLPLGFDPGHNQAIHEYNPFDMIESLQ